jgi:hypothetical protein
MNGFVNITLTPTKNAANSVNADAVFSQNISKIKVVGATIHYGINKLPIANVHIDPAGLSALLCDFDTVRRREVTLNIQSSVGCLSFEGIIDGNSISQQPGSLTSSFILKHRFTYLNEVYPRLLGINAGGTNIFTIIPSIAVEDSDLQNGGNWFAREQSRFLTLAPGLNFDQKVMPFMLDLFKAAVRLQMNYNEVVPAKQYANGDLESNLQNVMRDVQINAQSLGPTVLELLEKIDPSYTSGFEFNASSPLVGDKMVNDISLFTETLFSCMMRMLTEYNCAIVIGNQKAFIIPDAPYLKVTKTGSPMPGARSNSFNIAYPADYENFTFNDMGENTIKGVYVIAEPIPSEATTETMGVEQINGYYGEAVSGEPTGAGKPNKVFGNIVLKTLPGLVTTYTSYQGFFSTRILRHLIESGESAKALIAKPVETSEMLDSMDELKQELVKFRSDVQRFFNQWAQIEYCRIKYADRVGSISMPFNNKWIPGAPGTIYTRNPGTYIDMFVTDVTHNFSMSAPNGGNATTTVTYNSGRPGGNINDGLNSVDMFNYGYQDAMRFCGSYFNDITGKL